MNEAQRQFVMGVAGVRLWYAREPLPGAAPSPDFDFGEESSPAVIDEATERPTASPRPDSEASRQGLARLQGLLTDSATADSGRRQAPAKAERPASESAPVVERGETAPESDHRLDGAEDQSNAPVSDGLSGKTISFYWRFWLGDDWLLVGRCQDPASRALEDRLAANILRALGDQPVGSATLRWPVFNNPEVPGNDAAGALDVVAAIADKVKRSHQLRLGLEPETSDSAEASLWRQVTAPLGAASVSFPLTLAALSSDPAAKRSLWQALQQCGRP